MDITETLAPKSDQMDAIDLQHGERVFTIEKVTKGSADQPVQIKLAEFPRPWRPSKNMRRVMAKCWGTDASKWTGHQALLWCDPAVVFAGEAVGGIRIKALSHIDGPQKVALLVTRGKSEVYTVQPLTAQSPADALRTEWRSATPERRKEIEAEVARLETPAETPPDPADPWASGERTDEPEGGE